MYLNKVKEIRFARFLIVGTFNFLFDFTILRSLFIVSGNKPESGLLLVLFNTTSATAATIVSFFLNRYFVFRSNSDENPTKRIIIFLAVSLSGLYLVNNLILALFMHLLEDTGQQVYSLIPFEILSADSYQLLVAKGIATIGSLIWNYELYKRLVFRKKSE